jgi:hypothetical protein
MKRYVIFLNYPILKLKLLKIHVKMDNFDKNKWHTQPAKAPEGMYHQVRERIIQERIQTAKTHRQLVIGSALLLIVGAFNIGFIVFEKTKKQPISKANTQQQLYETYFDNTIRLSNEK